MRQALSAAGAVLGQFGVGLGAPMVGPQRIASRAARVRPPSGLPTLPLKLRRLLADGGVITERTVVEAFCNSSLFTYKDVPIYVSSAGSGAAAGLTPGTPTTLSTAMRTSTAGSHIILLDSMTVDPVDLRNTDASQASGPLAKLVDSNGFNLTLYTTGPVLASQTFTVDGTYSNVWNTTLTLSGSAALKRVVRTDMIDAYGKPTPFWKITASKAALSAYAGDAFYVSGTALSIKLATDGSVEAFKAALKGYYLGSAGTSRHLNIGAPACFWGNGGGRVYFDGVQVSTLDGGGRQPIVFGQGVDLFYAPGKGADLTACGQFVLSDSLVYGNEGDGVNAFVSSTVAKGLVQIVNSRLSRNGDVRMLAADGSLQGLSAHGGSDCVTFGCEMALNNGQGIADTCATSATDTSWHVGARVIGGASTSANFVFGSTATGARRDVWLDTCESIAPPTAGDLAIDANAVVNAVATSLPKVSGGTVANYFPGVFQDA